MSKRDGATDAVERGVGSLKRALGKLRQQYAVGFMQERLSPSETRRMLNDATPTMRSAMSEALGPDKFFEEIEKLGMLEGDDAAS